MCVGNSSPGKLSLSHGQNVVAASHKITRHWRDLRAQSAYSITIHGLLQHSSGKCCICVYLDLAALLPEHGARHAVGTLCTRQ